MRVSSALSTLVFCSFGLAVAIASGPLRFYAFGDWGGQTDWPYVTITQAICASQMGENAKAFRPEFVLSVGDNFYRDGVRDVHDRRFKNTFENVYSQETLSVPWYIIAGNHDWKGNVSAEIAYSSVSKRWNFPDYFYKFTRTIPGSNITVDIVMIDTTMLDPVTWEERTPDLEDYLSKNPRLRQSHWDWINDTLSQSTADWILVAGHHPVWSVAEHGPTKILVERLKPMMEKHGVAVYFSGHEHSVQHLVDGSSVDYVITGAGHQQTYSRAHARTLPNNVDMKYFWPGQYDFIPLGAFTQVRIMDRHTMSVDVVLGDGSKKYSFTKSNPRS